MPVQAGEVNLNVKHPSFHGCFGLLWIAGGFGSSKHSFKEVHYSHHHLSSTAVSKSTCLRAPVGLLKPVIANKSNCDLLLSPVCV
jgi:hypothetical protein